MSDINEEYANAIEAEQAKSGRAGATFVYAVKCLNCSLHYTIYSWGRWADLHDLGGYCPECGIRGNKAVWGPRPHTAFLFQLHNAGDDMPLIGMTEAEQVSPFGLGNMALPEDDGETIRVEAYEKRLPPERE